MKIFVAYLGIQIVALAIVGLHEPMTLIAIPFGLIAIYSVMTLVVRLLLPRKSEP